MLIVKIKKGENINSALKRFKRKFRDTRVVQEIRKRQEFVKPSELKRKQKQKAVYKAKFLRNNDI
jgi:small subunit ribosomal protein S21|tara:strand:- start:234 stop:428 length:195 start_codon:yes stop_codon:yes gene_type:complete